MSDREPTLRDNVGDDHRGTLGNYAANFGAGPGGRGTPSTDIACTLRDAADALVRGDLMPRTWRRESKGEWDGGYD